MIIECVIKNAQRARELQKIGSLAAFVWRFEPPTHSRPKDLSRAALATQAKTPGFIALSKELKSRGWSFVGPTAMYAFVQAAGRVNDHMRGDDAQEGCWLARKNFKVLAGRAWNVSMQTGASV